MTKTIDLKGELKKLNGETFVWNRIQYMVKKTAVVNNLFIIQTNRQSFNFLQSEFESWINKIEIIHLLLHDKNEDVRQSFPDKVVVAKPPISQTEIMMVENNAVKVSNKLMEIFDVISENPTDEALKKASAMVQVANSIINAQKHIFQIKTFNR